MTLEIPEYVSRLEAQADQIFDRMIDWRRDFHTHPELGNQEHRTAGIIAKHLRDIGCDEVREGLGGSTGVIALIKGDRPGPCVALRADMDALPVKETTGLEFASTATAIWGGVEVPVMHACGHDAHSAVLMAVGEILCDNRADIAGTVMLIFQPAEEAAAPDWEGLSGAERLIADGAFDDPRPEAFFCFHVLQGEPRGSAGQIKVHEGAGSYAMSLFRLHIEGRGGHGAKPWLTIDPLVIGAQTLLALQTIPAKNVDVNENDVTLSVGIFQGGTKFNVIPITCLLEGALRFTDEASRAYLEERVEAVASHTAAAAGGTAHVDWFSRVPLVYNDPDLFQIMRPSLTRAAPGPGMVETVKHCFLDDVARLTEIAPLMFYTVSVALDKDDPNQSGYHHESDFFVNEKGLLPALKSMLGLAVDFGHRKTRNSASG